MLKHEYMNEMRMVSKVKFQTSDNIQNSPVKNEDDDTMMAANEQSQGIAIYLIFINMINNIVR